MYWSSDAQRFIPVPEHFLPRASGSELEMSAPAMLWGVGMRGGKQWPFNHIIRVRGWLSLGVSETVKFVARHTKNYDLLRIFNLAIMLSHLGRERAENHIF